MGHHANVLLVEDHPAAAGATRRDAAEVQLTKRALLTELRRALAKVGAGGRRPPTP